MDGYIKFESKEVNGNNCLSVETRIHGVNKVDKMMLLSALMKSLRMSVPETLAMLMAIDLGIDKETRNGEVEFDNDLLEMMRKIKEGGDN